MNNAELEDRTEEAQKVVEKEFGKNLGALAITPGTGWKQGIEAAFKEDKRLPYSELNVPGSEFEVEGHSKDLRLGTVEGRPVIIAGRVHPNENWTHPDLRQAMSVVIGAIDECMDGLLVTNGVGHLHGCVGRDQGLIKSMLRTAILDVVGWAHRGRRKDPIKVGDIAIADDIKTALVGPSTPFGAGDFEDFYNEGLHANNDLFFDTVRQAITLIQGHCPRAQARFIGGPQFEGPGDKVEFRAQGDDVIGMSGLQEILEATRRGIPVAQAFLATNGPFGLHSHDGNQIVGKQSQAKAEAIVRRLAQATPKRR
jgi:hypothetical protein